MEKTQELKRLQVICKFGSYLLLILAILMAVSMIVLASSAFVPEVTEEVLDISGTDAYVMISALLIGAAFIFLVLYKAYQLMRNLSIERTPFIRKNVKTLKTISILLLVSGIADNIVSWIISIYYSNIDYSLSVAFILSAIIVYSITLIFQYGVALQEESDMTV